VLQLATVPDPVPAAGEVLLRVHATAVNRADLLQRQGRYPPPPGEPEILGLEAAGEVAALGPGVAGPAVGTPVMALLGGGGYAEAVAVPVGQLMAVPDGLDTVAAAAIPEVFVTADLTLRILAGVQAGETVLVHSGASGLGLAACQIARALGANVVVTSRSAGRLATAEELGAVGLVATDGRFADAVVAATGGRGVDVVLDLVGAAYWRDNVACLATGGRIVLTGLVGGRTAQVDLAALISRQATVIASSLRGRSRADKARIVAAFADRWSDALATGRLRPVVDRVMPLDDVADAHRRVGANGAVGKVVLRVR
jgi:putative PIG3 family NAD(P)H quinone oxidoreductase